MPVNPLRSQASLGFTAGALPHAVMKNAATSALQHLFPHAAVALRERKKTRTSAG